MFKSRPADRYIVRGAGAVLVSTSLSNGTFEMCPSVSLSETNPCQTGFLPLSSRPRSAPAEPFRACSFFDVMQLSRFLPLSFSYHFSVLSSMRLLKPATFNLHRVTIAFCLLAFTTVTRAASPVLINEIFYHPASTNVLEEWVELYNPAVTNVNLSGWKFSKGLQFTFPTNTTINAGGWLVIAADTNMFNVHNPGVTNLLAASAGPLSGHTLTLDDNAAARVNSVTYYGQGDWAAHILTTNGFASYGHAGWEWYAPHDGLGNTLELINPALPNSYAHNWASSTNIGGTPGRANSVSRTNAAPFITSVAHLPIIPQPTDVVTVSARLVDEHTNGVTVTLFYRNATSASPPAFTSAPMFDDGAHNDGLAADGIYAAILPAQPSSTIIEFYLQASDLEGNIRTYPAV